MTMNSMRTRRTKHDTLRGLLIMNLMRTRLTDHDTKWWLMTMNSTRTRRTKRETIRGLLIMNLMRTSWNHEAKICSFTKLMIQRKVQLTEELILAFCFLLLAEDLRLLQKQIKYIPLRNYHEREITKLLLLTIITYWIISIYFFFTFLE